MRVGRKIGSKGSNRTKIVIKREAHRRHVPVSRVHNAIRRAHGVVLRVQRSSAWRNRDWGTVVRMLWDRLPAKPWNCITQASLAMVLSENLWYAIVACVGALVNKG